MTGSFNLRFLFLIRCRDDRRAFRQKKNKNSIKYDEDDDLPLERRKRSGGPCAYKKSAEDM